MTIDDQDTVPSEGSEDDKPTVRDGNIDPDATIGVTQDAPASTNPIQIIGGYELIKELGAGGQGAVYLAEDKKLKRQVALKLLSGAANLSAHMRLRFEREAETTSRLNHPGIARVFELGNDQGILFIAMELVEGQTLESRIYDSKNLSKQNKSLSELKTSTSHSTSSTSKTGSSSATGSDERPFLAAIRFLEETARALHSAHLAGLIHRDIKPANIMMRPDGSSCILDFGLVHDQESQEMTLTQTGDIFGTPTYMAPEQVQGQTSKIDPRTDVWALGAVLYECCTLKRPFTAPTRHELFQSIIQDEPVAPSRTNPKIPKDLDAIILTAIDKDPERRYASALEFAEDLRRLREYEVVHARPAGRWVKAVRWAQRNRVIAASGFIVFISLLAAAGVFYVKGEEAKDSRDAALKAKTEASESRDAALLAQKDAETARDLAKSESEQKSVALAAEKVAVADFERLADVKKLQEASTSAEALWPARPDKIEDIKAWLDKYEKLSHSLSGHEDALTSLQASALPYTEEDRLRDHAADLTQLTSLRKNLAKNESDLAEATTEDANAKIQANIDAIKKSIAALATQTKEQISWNFGDDDVKQWKHDVLLALVKDMEKFVAIEGGTYTDVKARLANAQTIAKKTIADHQALWDKTAAAVKSSDKYDGLILKPQLGLIPLGMDPESKLHEFLHLETHEGALPERDKNGKISMTGKTGIILVLIPKGKFWTGSQKTDKKGQNYDPQSRPDETLREVEISKPFFLSKYEMTQGQWMRSPWPVKSPSNYGVGWNYKGHKGKVSLINPVEQVSRTMCTKNLGRVGLQLPTEEQWEYAARAGTSSIWVGDTGEIKGISSWGNIAGLETKGIFSLSESLCKDDYIVHAPVGQFKANAFGLLDVLGNVWEWTATKTSSSARVRRGGSFNGTAIGARVARRSIGTEGLRHNSLGFAPLARFLSTKLLYHFTTSPLHHFVRPRECPAGEAMRAAKRSAALLALRRVAFPVECGLTSNPRIPFTRSGATLP